GVMLAHTTIDEDKSTDFGNSELKAKYRAIQSRLALTYDSTPFPNQKGVLGRTHLMLYAGVLSSDANVEISDGVVEMKDDHAAVGSFGGFEIRWPIMQFWIG